MSEKRCNVCNKILSETEIKINERSRRTRYRGKRYLCSDCRRKEYEQYQKSIKDLIEEKI